MLTKEKLSEQLATMRLHDNTGDPYDVGYGDVVEEIRQWADGEAISAEQWVNGEPIITAQRLRSKLDSMRLHDNTGDEADQGYSAAIAELDAFVAESV
jgi:hypothetical protein